jgi:prephenate dehydratase
MSRNPRILVILTLLLLVCSTALASVSYLGPAGTYTEEATIRFFGSQETITPVSTVAVSLAQLKAGECRYAVVPVENTIGGPVYNYLDSVINDPAFVVVGQVDLPIRQTLLAVPGAKLADIKTILSHPQGIAQSRAWLKANLPDAQLIEVASTAEAARRVAEAGDTAAAAIAASRTADVYSLAILANDLQYTDTNVTRFWVVTLKTNQTFSGDKAAILARGPLNQVSKLLASLDAGGYQLVAVHDRPALTRLGEYQVVIQVAGDNPKTTLEQILAKQPPTLACRLLGRFAVK